MDTSKTLPHFWKMAVVNKVLSARNINVMVLLEDKISKNISKISSAAGWT